MGLLRMVFKTGALLLATFLVFFQGATYGAEAFTPRYFVSETEVVSSAFSGPFKLEKKSVSVSDSQRALLQQKLGSRWDIEATTWQNVVQNGRNIGYSLIMDELGKHLPITFCVVLTSKKDIAQVGVLIYRESVGSEIRKRRFMKQFDGKKVSDLTKLSQTVPITGATLSSWAATVVVKKSLLIGEYLIP